MPDPQKQIYRGGVGEITEKKSRFIASVAAVSDREAAEEFIAVKKKEYWDARHNCSAYIIADTVNIQHSSDDGEPPGTAGKPIMEVLMGEGLTNVCVVVTRYFGGTLLGTGGLVRAYQAATRAGLAESVIMERREGMRFELSADYGDAGKLRYYFAQNEIPVIRNDYGQDVTMEILIPIDQVPAVEKEIANLTAGRITLPEGESIDYAPVEGEMKIWKRDSMKS
ncbi:MAG: YigZ family protein [Lachnospiraceae bacterium]|nr:YigZ family protein [Lachnospiraceae bacterium]